MIMSKEKICKVCQAFKDKNYINEIVLHINKLIKSKQPTDILNKESGLIFTNHYYKKHREECLINFEIPIEKQKIVLKENIENTENSFNSSTDIYKIINEYRNMSFEDKEKAHLKNIDEIKYLIGYITINNLINSGNYKGFIIKDDINSLKTINDIANDNINLDFKLSFKGKNSQEIFNNSIEDFNQGKISLRQMFDITKLAYTMMKIENYTNENKSVKEQISIDEAKEFAKELEETIQNLDDYQNYLEYKNKNA